ncbi:hypothetical protein VTJ04DRAFT_7808 [Mycothermus thermophilus]|uniref:uncharacterized protein n=1 Tax=Humicola insolens TaxID=85995 RepID=UPI003743D3C0
MLMIATTTMTMTMTLTSQHARSYSRPRELQKRETQRHRKKEKEKTAYDDKKKKFPEGYIKWFPAVFPCSVVLDSTPEFHPSAQPLIP